MKDITYCTSKCNRKRCERHISHRPMPWEMPYFSTADLKGTDYCILEEKNDNDTGNKGRAPDPKKTALRSKV